MQQNSNKACKVFTPGSQTDLHTVFYLLGVSVLQIYKGDHLGKELFIEMWVRKKCVTQIKLYIEDVALFDFCMIYVWKSRNF